MVFGENFLISAPRIASLLFGSPAASKARLRVVALGPIFSALIMRPSKAFLSIPACLISVSSSALRAQVIKSPKFDGGFFILSPFLNSNSNPDYTRKFWGYFWGYRDIPHLTD